MNSGVNTIPRGIFSDNKFTELTIPSNITTIDESAFSANQIIALNIPDSVTTIGNFALGNNQLTTIIIPESVAVLGGNAFSSNRLTSVTISNPSIAMQHSSFADNPISSMTIGSTTYIEQSPTIDPACFAMSGSSVTGYFRNSPVIARDHGVLCGRNIAIPDSVDAIGSSALSNRQLVSVSIPDSVTTIGRYALSFNYLNAVNIGSGLSDIAEGVFMSNRLTEVHIPNNITFIHPFAFALQNPADGDITSYYFPSGIYSNDPSIVQAAYDSIWYVRLYTEDPSNPNNLQSGFLSEDWWSGSDYNNNGHLNDSLGGHLINPAQVTLNYRSSTNSQLHQSVTYVGKRDDGSYITSYLAKDNIFPIPLDPENPTPEEQAALQAGLSRYFSPNQTITIEPLAITGYITPDPITLTLGTNGNNVDFVYATSQDVGGGTGGQNDAEEVGDRLAETGSSVVAILTAASLAIGSGLIVAVRRR